MIYRIAIANVSAEHIAKTLQDVGFAGTLTPALGFGQWGTEHTTVLECATDDGMKLLAAVRTLLFAHKEEAAYVTVDGRSPSLLWNDGRLTALAA